MFTCAELEAAAALVYRQMSPTPQYAWPLLAALMQEREVMRGRKVGVILCGGNIDTDWFLTVLRGGVPKV
jgi:threonine dehydratase